ncbi:hypothetical protein [Variovorax sp. PAMC 28711]|uniref:hypothetical protein n=1 Tax=Variovorax sp. PAMC 28711 TaxID=1795631 RepID=UPI00078DE236|nr:hypothetical protein [Variovorax sp. PAMC 28711]AMM25539.1 hypothetical protein AX767_15090 [Variovorax sp. PAMC 28711]
MHSAPSVTYPVGRSRYATRLLALIWAAGACCAGAACYSLDHVGWRGLLLVASTVLAGAAALGSLIKAPVANLAFDGQRWSLSGEPSQQIADAIVVLDFQVLLLVRLDVPRASARWLWLERRAQPAIWHDVRRALYSRAPSAVERALPGVP